MLLIGRECGPGTLRLTVTASTVRPAQLTVPLAAMPRTVRELVEAAIPPDLDHDDVLGHPAWRHDMTVLLAQEIVEELSSPPRALRRAGHALDGPGGHLR
ncbi:hypothetical protein ACTXJ3_13290 [Brachybacterium paraconglomeratum]|uniref:hypothetical protein n=1 Tax=Brachybacterium paraconglomeratum TaxID=173362 RepID=UPI003FD2637E